VVGHPHALVVGHPHALVVGHPHALVVGLWIPHQRFAPSISPNRQLSQKAWFTMNQAFLFIGKREYDSGAKTRFLEISY